MKRCSISLASLVVAAVLGGCGDVVAENGTGQTPTCHAPPLAPKPAADGAGAHDVAVAQGLAELDAIFGVVLRGDVVIYRGHASAHDAHGAHNPSATDPTVAHTAMADGDAIALWSVEDTASSSWLPQDGTPQSGKTAVLVLHGIAAQQKVGLVQTDDDVAAGVLRATAIDDDNAFGARATLSCTGCAPNLLEHPAALSLDVDATGTDSVFVFGANPGDPGQNVDVPADTAVTAQLTAADPCSLTFADFDVAEDLDVFSPWTQQGSEHIRHFTGSDGGTHGRGCFWSTSFSADLFVNDDNLADYGVRNVQTDLPQYQCPP